MVMIVVADRGDRLLPRNRMPSRRRFRCQMQEVFPAGPIHLPPAPWEFPKYDEGRGPIGSAAFASRKRDQLVQVPPELFETLVQVSAKMCLSTPPKANTMMTIRAAMPAISRPYSTADAPRSSILALCASSMMRR